MTFLLSVLWVCIISLFSVGGAYYARRTNRSDALVVFYVTTVIFSNITAAKIIAFDLGFIEFFAPAAVLTFAVTFLLTDIVNERFGKQETQRMILLALFAQITVSVYSYLIIHAHPAPFFMNQAAFESIFASVPRIMIASFIAFYVSENLDAILFQWFRRLTGGRHLWLRNAFSSIPAMASDSVIFVTIAFAGVLPLMPIIVGLVVIKWLVAVLDVPFMYLSRVVMGR